MDALAEPMAGLGHNQPPEPTPYEAIKVHVDDLMVEARNWADGQLIETQEQADTVSRLIDDFRKAMKVADDARVTENEPFDRGKAEVQERYGALIADTKTKKGTAVLAIESLKATLKPYLNRLETERRERERLAREEADRKAREAAEAIRAAQDADLESREAAEALLVGAKRAEAEAKAVTNERAHAHGGDRAMGVRRYWVARLSDRKAALLHYVVANPDAVTACLQQLADQDVRAGKRQVPGFEITEETRL